MKGCVNQEQIVPQFEVFICITHLTCLKLGCYCFTCLFLSVLK